MKIRILTALALLALLVLPLTSCAPAPLTGAEGDTNFTNIVLSGDLTVGDTLNVDGDIDYDGDGFDVSVTGGFSIDGTDSSNVTVTGSSKNLTLSSSGGSVIIQPTEGAADAIHLDANAAAGTGIDIDVGATNGMSLNGGCFNIGTGTPASCGDKDVVIAGDLEVEALLNVDGTFDFDGTTFDVLSSGGFSIDDSATASNVSVAGAGTDLTLSSAAGRVIIQGSEAAANAVTIDADAAAGVGLDVDVGASGGMSVDGGCLNIGTGTPASCGDKDVVIAGDLEVEAMLNVDGTVDFDGTTFDVLSSGGFSIDDSAANSNVSVAGAGIDLTLSSAAGRVVIQASEATPDAVFIDANANATAGLDIDVGATTGVTIDGGMLNVGGGSCSVADGDDDVCIAAVLEVDGELELDGALDADSTSNFEGAATFQSTVALGADVTLAADSSGGNLGAKTEYIGLPRIKFIGMGGGTDPGAQTIELVDDTPNGEYAAVDASAVLSLSTTVVKYGTNSLKIAWNADAVATDGFLDAGLGAAGAWDDMESVGMLVQSDTAWASGDLTLVLTDDGGARTFSIPALTATDTWVWLEVNIATGDLSAISDVAILMSAQGEGALAAFNMYLDIMYCWDSTDEDALGYAIQQDGVLGVVDNVDATNLAELTNYIIHYESGVDFLVWITNESASLIEALVAY